MLLKFAIEDFKADRELKSRLDNDLEEIYESLYKKMRDGDENFIKIVDNDDELIPFVLNDQQQHFIDDA